MVINILASIAVPVKPNEETNSKKKKRKIRLQHPQQQGKEFEVEIVNDDGKPICSICKTTFEKMKSLYSHMKKAHSDVNWKTFLNTKMDMIEEANKKVVVIDSISMEKELSRWKVTRKKRSALRVDDDGGVNKIPKMYNDDAADLEAAANLLFLRYGDQYHPASIAEESQSFKFDLNQPPPLIE